MHKSLVIALAAAAVGVSSAPAPVAAPLSNSEFTLSMTYPLEDHEVTEALVAYKNDSDSDEEYQLIGERPSVYSGTRAYVNPVSPEKDFVALEYDILKGVPYGLFAEDIVRTAHADNSTYIYIMIAKSRVLY